MLLVESSNVLAIFLLEDDLHNAVNVEIIGDNFTLLLKEFSRFRFLLAFGLILLVEFVSATGLESRQNEVLIVTKGLFDHHAEF